MPLRPSTRTFADVSRMVKRSFGDESSVQIDDTDIMTWANEAQTQIVQKNHNLKAVGTSSSVPGQASYDFPSQMISQVEALLYDGQVIKNVDIAKAMTTIMEADPQQEDEGTPNCWYEWGGQFVLYPKPLEAKDITIYYTMYPDEITQDNQLLAVPNKYFQAVVDYCLWKAYELDEDWAAASVKENHFRVSLEEQSEEEREAENIVYPVIQEMSW